MPKCPNAPNALELVGPRDAQFVKAGLVSSVTTRGEPLCVPKTSSELMA
jgi:hypothetical protein